MHKLNRIFTLSSISVLLVTIERFSFTTKILLQPYNFLRLHELIQMSLLIWLTVIIPSMLLKEITQGLKTVKTKKDWSLILLFITGIYFYATGNGVHEIASFYVNTYCNVKDLVGNLCNSLFFNDYYTGNILYFIGGILMLIPLLLLEKSRPTNSFTRKDFVVLVVNAVIYALAIFAYAAFDVVLVGLVYSVIMSAVATILFLMVRHKYRQYPVITYTFLTYVLGTVAAILTKVF